MNDTTRPTSAEQDPKRSVVVIGLGPAGIVAALEAARKGYNVVAITDRPATVDKEKTGYVRPQRIKLNATTIKYLLKYTNFANHDDRKFISRLIREWGTVQLKDLERFLFHKLEQQQKVIRKGRIRIIAPAAKDASSKPKILSINTQKLNIKVRHRRNQDLIDEEIPFQHIIGAGGGKRPTRKLLEQQTTHSKKNFTYEPINAQLRYKHQFTASLQLKSEATSRPRRFPRKLSMADMKDLKTFGKKIKKKYETLFKDANNKLPDRVKELKFFNWDEKFLPEIYILPNANKNKFYVAGEIPMGVKLSEVKKAHNIKDDEKAKETLAKINRWLAIEWAKFILHKTHNISVDDLEVKPTSKHAGKTNLRVTRFDMGELTAAEDSVIDVSPNLADRGSNVIALVGDERGAPHFHYAHGVNDAIFGTREAVACLPKPTTKGIFNMSRFIAVGIALTSNLVHRIKTREKEQRSELEQAYDDFLDIIDTLENHRSKLDKRGEIKAVTIIDAILKNAKEDYLRIHTDDKINFSQTLKTISDDKELAKFRGSIWRKMAGRLTSDSTESKRLANELAKQAGKIWHTTRTLR